MVKTPKNRFHIVPVLMHMLDILEFLSGTDVPLRMDEIANETGVSRTTTYRILQTLVYRRYLAHDLEGKYSLANVPEVKSSFQKHGNPTNAGPSAAGKRSVT